MNNSADGCVGADENIVAYHNRSLVENRKIEISDKIVSYSDIETKIAGKRTMNSEIPTNRAENPSGYRLPLVRARRSC